jgi:hypothetical protein
VVLLPLPSLVVVFFIADAAAPVVVSDDGVEHLLETGLVVDG